MVQRREYLPCEDKLREVRLFCLKRRRLQGDLGAAFQYLMGARRKNGRLFSWVCCDRTRGSGLKLNEKRFILDIKKEVYGK